MLLHFAPNGARRFVELKAINMSSLQDESGSVFFYFQLKYEA